MNLALQLPAADAQQWLRLRQLRGRQARPQEPPDQPQRVHVAGRGAHALVPELRRHPLRRPPAQLIEHRGLYVVGARGDPRRAEVGQLRDVVVRH